MNYTDGYIHTYEILVVVFMVPIHLHSITSRNGDLKHDGLVQNLIKSTTSLRALYQILCRFPVFKIIVSSSISMEYFLDNDYIMLFCHILGAFFYGINRGGDVDKGQSWIHPPS